MLKRVLCILAVGLALTTVAAAQSPGEPSDGALLSDLAAAWMDANSPLSPPSYCPPAPAVPKCVFYSGDFSPKPLKEPNGLFNEIFHDGANTIDGQVWVPFSVKKKIKVQQVFVNELFASPPPPTALAHWEIRNGVSAGSGGVVQCGGSGTAVATPTGRTFTANATTYTEYTYMLTIPSADYCELYNPAPPADSIRPDQPSGGKGSCPPNCYLSVTTEDTSAAAAPLALNFAYLSDIPNPAPHHYGLPNIYDNSFFTSTFYGQNFVPATTACTVGPPVAITTVGCHMFSVGIVGAGR